jgi:hypothetical protein
MAFPFLIASIGFGWNLGRRICNRPRSTLLKEYRPAPPRLSSGRVDLPVSPTRPAGGLAGRVGSTSRRPPCRPGSCRPAASVFLGFEGRKIICCPGWAAEACGGFGYSSASPKQLLALLRRGNGTLCGHAAPPSNASARVTPPTPPQSPLCASYCNLHRVLESRAVPTGLAACSGLAASCLQPGCIVYAA